MKLENKGTGKPAPNCQYKNHSTNPTRMYHYWDDNNGLPEKGIKICRECYAEHILKFYPNSIIADHIRNNLDEYKNN